MKKRIALAGNPNVGKSTVFNVITGLKQHTGNWSGKTVDNAISSYTYNNKEYDIIDIPGTYSINANSSEEIIARDLICFGKVDEIVVVADATLLEKNISFILQVMEARKNVIVAVNLMDQAKKEKIEIDLDKLAKMLNTKVIGCSARINEGIKELLDELTRKKEIDYIKIDYSEKLEKYITILEPTIKKLEIENINSRFIAIKLIENDSSFLDSLNYHIGYNINEIEEINEILISIQKDIKLNNIEIKDEIVNGISNKSYEIYNKIIQKNDNSYQEKFIKFDKLITSKKIGIPVIMLIFMVILWITLIGANYPSEILSSVFFWFKDVLLNLLSFLRAPSWLSGILIEGIYTTLVWVISVMLPPMAIFFPLFGILEDSGILPRIAFNLDSFFKRSGASGKQSLTMMMGFGCNACGVNCSRIIDSPRERILAIITNNFVPCNGRFPILIVIIAMFFVRTSNNFINSLLNAFFLTIIISFGVIITLLISKILSKTILKGYSSFFTMEMPKYRKPSIKNVIVRNTLDKTLTLLLRAVKVALPFGAIIWLISTITINDNTILRYMINFFQPLGKLMGLDGNILSAFILGFPANEIVLPIISMSYLSMNNLIDIGSVDTMRTLFINNGWTFITAINMLIFTLFHWPCATTCLTIKAETKSFKWTFLSFIMPTIIGIILCILINIILGLFF